MPHDIAINNDNLYISEIGEDASKLVKKFKINNLVQISGRAEILNLKLINERFRPKSKRVEDTQSVLELEKLKSNSQTEKTDAFSTNKTSTVNLSVDQPNKKAKKTSLLLFIIFISSLLLISMILFVLKSRIGIENYFRSLGLPTRIVYSKDLHINDPEGSGFNLLREDEENLFDFELENNDSESEIEEFNFKNVRKV